ncbi:MAG: sugar ABC transporter permease [Candidatus Promineifilaceae bacterium]
MSESTIKKLKAMEIEQPTFTSYVEDWLVRVRAGDLGSLPIIIGIIAIAAIFGTLSEGIFFRERNFVNLLLQMSGLAAISTGVVFVLLIAEIDLSVGFVGAVGGVTMTLLLREANADWPWWAAIGASLLVVTLIGLLHGLIITKASVPSFVVTLAGLLAWSGVVLILTTSFSTAGTIVIQDPVVLGIANSYLPTLWGWTLFVVAVLFYAGTQISTQQSLRNKNLAGKPSAVIALEVIALIVLAGGAVWYANQDRGVPTSAVIVIVFLLIWSFVANRTKFGRYVYAVGGNPEAARRAGIDVDRIRISVFMISSFMAGIGGIILASRLRSVDTNTGGGNLLLNAIAAAVIGGTSLFGGSGKVTSALLGALIIASVENGMGLMGWASGVKFVVNGSVLLAAVLVDSFSRRSRSASGIA